MHAFVNKMMFKNSPKLANVEFYKKKRTYLQIAIYKLL